MTDRDPYREHHGRQRPERRNSIPVLMDSAARVLTEGRRWTPLGIGIMVAAPPVLIFMALFLTLGKDGLLEVAAAWRASANADGALAKEVERLSAKVDRLSAKSSAELDAVRSDLAAYSTRIDAARKDNAVTSQQVVRVCDLASALNGGRPREDWCGDPGQGTIFFGPSLGAVTPYHLTAAHWTK